MLFSNAVFPQTPSTGTFCGLGGVGEKVVDVLEKNYQSVFCLLSPDPQLQQEVAAGRPNFKGLLQEKLSLFDPLNLEF